MFLALPVSSSSSPLSSFLPLWGSVLSTAASMSFTSCLSPPTWEPATISALVSRRKSPLLPLPAPSIGRSLSNSPIQSLSPTHPGGRRSSSSSSIVLCSAPLPFRHSLSSCLLLCQHLGTTLNSLDFQPCNVFIRAADAAFSCNRVERDDALVVSRGSG